MNTFQELFNKLFKKEQPLSAPILQQGLTSLDIENIRRMGVTTNGVQEIINRQLEVSYDRWSTYQELFAMLTHPLASGSVELMTEYATCVDKNNGTVVHCTSQYPAYKKVIDALFERIGIEEKIFDWAYTLVTFGEIFVQLEGTPGIGIVSTDDSKAPIEWYRIDNNGQLIGFFNRSFSGVTSGTTTNNDILAPWTCVHFRVNGSKKRRVATGDTHGYRTSIVGIGGNSLQESTNYGTSFLMPAIPTYKRLRLAEDVVMLTRATRGPLKYAYCVAVDPKTCLAGNTEIKLLDGTVHTIKEMADNRDLYIGRGILTVNPNTLELETGYITEAQKTRLNTDLLRVYLDNNTSVDCTPDHRFMLRDGSYKEAKDLEIGQSLMPLYEKLMKNAMTGYTATYDPSINKYRANHKIVTGHVKRGLIVHHKDFNKLNNDPSNLEIMTQSEHVKLHNEAGHCGGKSIAGRKQTEEHRRKRLEKRKVTLEFNPHILINRVKKFKETKLKNRQQFIKIIKCKECEKEFETIIKDENNPRNRKFCSLECAYKGRKMVKLPLKKHGKTGNTIPIIRRKCKCGCGYKKEVHVTSLWRYKCGHQPKDNLFASKKRKNNKVINHKVVRIEYLQHREDTYDLTIDRNHNFPLANGIFVHNSNMSAIKSVIDSYASLLKRARSINTTEGQRNFQDTLSNLGSTDDVIVPVWGDINSFKIEKLGDSPDVKWITDVDMLQNQFVTALGVPIALLGGYSEKGTGGFSGGEALDKLDIRFSRKVGRIQSAIKAGITRLIQIHLAYLKMDPDPKYFEIHVGDTSTSADNEAKEVLLKSCDAADKFIDVLTKITGEDQLDREKTWNILNDRVFKLKDISFTDFIKGDTGSIAKSAEELTINDSVKDHISNVDLNAHLPMDNYKYPLNEWKTTYSQYKVTIKPVKEM